MCSADLQRPCQISVEVCINTLHVCQAHSLSKNHFVECADEEGIKEASMEYRKTYNTANKLEIVQMLGVDA